MSVELRLFGTDVIMPDIIEFLLYLEFSLDSRVQVDFSVWADVLTALRHRCQVGNRW